MYTIATITSEDVRLRIEDEVIDLEENDHLLFPDTEARFRFIEDCTDTALSWHECNPSYYDCVVAPDYTSIVMDAAELEGYLT